MVLGELAIRDWSRPGTEAIPDDVLDWLRALGRPTLFRIAGRRRDELRVAATLLHGNEPSGVRAMHDWLRQGREPACDAWLLVAGPAVALYDEPFGHRAIPDLGDLNRDWLDPGDDEPGRMVHAVLAALDSERPRYLIDLHNNTGHNPPYGVGCKSGPTELGLVSLFGRRHIHSDLRLGSLVEATQPLCPSVTIECGRAGNPEADAIAIQGLTRFLEDPDLEATFAPASVQVLDDPVRVSLKPGLSLAFSDQPVPGIDLTVVGDVDRHNFEQISPGTHVGWLREGTPWPIEALGADGTDRSRDWFVLRDDWLETRVPLMPVMMTTVVANASMDCLFYVVSERS